ncbi:MAG: serine/threonine protein kinase [Planctomycetota bacterium]|nr:MAG: serine/threonine protein kinase [Planctomycetota bacterium]
MSSSEERPDEADGALPTGTDDLATEIDPGDEDDFVDEGETTMDEVPAGLLGSTDAYRQALRESQFGVTRAAPSGEGRAPEEAEAVEAELVRSSATHPTLRFTDTAEEAVGEDPGEPPTRITEGGEETGLGGSTESDLGSSEETIAMGAATLADIQSQGRRRLGDFELERKIGQGGMGEVWLARQVSLDRPVAVKVLPRSLATQENFIERFQREAKAAASLVHPNVIQIYAYGIDEGTPYFAMEYVEGEDLQQRMRRAPLEWGEIVDIMVGVSSALQAAHSKGLIHRDVKPSNIMIDKTGLVKVMDFGLAKATGGGSESKSLTSAGLIMGTPNYLSPEQGRGDPLDGRSDLYSLGIVLYELLTGSLPFRADTPAGLIFKHVYEPPPPPDEINPEIPPFLVEIVLKLLEKDPDDRYASAQEFAADLAEFIDNYDYYVEQGGSRRPGAGYLDANRLKGSGSFSTSGVAKRRISERRSAVTEEVTQPELSPAEDEPPPPPQEPTPAPRRRSSSRRAAAPVPAKPPRRPAPPSPRRRLAPTLLLLLLLTAAGGAGYAYTYHREAFMQTLRQVGFDFLPRERRTSPDATPGSGSKPLVVTGDETIPFVYEGVWPEGAEVVLARPSIGRVLLERGKQHPLPPGEYELRFTRPGYEPYSLPVRLVRQGGRGALVDVGGGELRIEPKWVPGRALREAYSQGKRALEQDDLPRAREALERAAAFDPDYRPPDVRGQRQPTVAELRRRLEERLDSELAAAGRLRELTQRVEGLVGAKRWRAALDALLSVDEAERDEVLRQFEVRCRERIEEGAQLEEDTARAIAAGDFEHARADLARLGEEFPEFDEGGALARRLEEARAFRADALRLGVDQDLSAAKAKLEAYLKLFGPKDRLARKRLAEIERQIEAAKEIRRREVALQALADAGDWVRARNDALALLELDPGNAVAQEVRRGAESALAERAVARTIRELDRALAARDFDSLVRLLDPESPSYARERRAFLDLTRVGGRFHSSVHENLEVTLSPSLEAAEARGRWVFELSVLGEPARQFVAQHVIALRRVGKRWLVREVQAQGGVRVRR